MKRAISTAMILATVCSTICTPAMAVETAILRAFRETFGTSCIWQTDPVLQLTLESYLPLIEGDVAALIVRTGEGGTKLNSFSFNLQFAFQLIFLNVKPGVNIEYDDNGKEHQILHLALSDLTVTKQEGGKSYKVSYDFVQKMGHPVKVRHIVIGGRQLPVTNNRGLEPGTAAMKIILSSFEAYNSSGFRLGNNENMDVKVESKGADPLMQGLKCVVAQ